MLYPASQIRNFVTGLDHPEGIAVDCAGTLYAGGEAGQVYRISPDGKTVETIAATGGFCLGITLDQCGGVYACDSGNHAVLRIAPNGSVETVADSVGGERLSVPNFSVFDSQGNLFFSDSGEWKHANGVVHKIAPNGSTTLFSAGPFQFANGLALDAVEKFLYLVESNLDRVLRIEMRSDGTAGVPEVYAEGLERVPDGMAFDTEGNLYVTTYASNCIYRVRPNRHVELLCHDAENLALCQPTNCAFGGSNFDQLYVANLGRNHISVLDLKIKGQPLWCHRMAKPAATS
ncbi:MAG: SMP-30/gluconolactonase/LRE family protein [Terriglobia bacterium]